MDVQAAGFFHWKLGSVQSFCLSLQSNAVNAAALSCSNFVAFPFVGQLSRQRLYSMFARELRCVASLGEGTRRQSNRDIDSSSCFTDCKQTGSNHHCFSNCQWLVGLPSLTLVGLSADMVAICCNDGKLGLSLQDLQLETCQVHINGGIKAPIPRQFFLEPLQFSWNFPSIE